MLAAIEYGITQGAYRYQATRAYKAHNTAYIPSSIYILFRVYLPITGNDPSAGSPTDTLLRLLLSRDK